MLIGAHWLNKLSTLQSASVLGIYALGPDDIQYTQHLAMLSVSAMCMVAPGAKENSGINARGLSIFLSGLRFEFRCLV